MTPHQTLTGPGRPEETPHSHLFLAYMASLMWPQNGQRGERHSLWKPQFRVETSLPQPSWGQAHFLWKQPQCYLNCRTGPVSSSGPAWVGAAQTQPGWGQPGASLLQPPGPQGSKYTVPSQLLLAVVAESKGVQVCGNLSLYVYVSALTWRLGFVLSRGWVLRGPHSRLSVRTDYRRSPAYPNHLSQCNPAVQKGFLVQKSSRST